MLELTDRPYWANIKRFFRAAESTKKQIQILSEVPKGGVLGLGQSGESLQPYMLGDIVKTASGQVAKFIRTTEAGNAILSVGGQEIERSLGDLSLAKKAELPANAGLGQAIAPKMNVATTRKVEREIADSVIGKILDNAPIGLSKEAQAYLSQFRPTEPVTLYRAKTNFGGEGHVSRYLGEGQTESWTRDKQIALDFVGGDKSKIETRIVNPDEILLDTTMLPKSILNKIKDPSGDLGDIREVIAREQEVVLRKKIANITEEHVVGSSKEKIPTKYQKNTKLLVDGLSKMEKELGVSLRRADEYIAKGQTPFNSTYRSATKNKEVGGIIDSAHGKNMAVDIPTTSLKLDQMKVAQAAHNAGFLVEDLAKTPDHVHIELPGSGSSLEKNGLQMKFREGQEWMATREGAGVEKNIVSTIEQAGGKNIKIVPLKDTIYRDESFNPVEQMVQFDDAQGSTHNLPFSKVTLEGVKNKIQSIGAGQRPPVEPPKTTIANPDDFDRIRKDYIRATNVGEVMSSSAAAKQAIENESFLIKSYEKDIAKLEDQLKISEYNTEAEKIKAQDRLQALQDKYKLAKTNQKMKQDLKDEVSSLVKEINKESSGNIAVEYQDAINKLKDKFDLKNRQEATLAKRESMKAYVERMKVEGRPIDIPKDKLEMLDKVTLNDMTIDQLREIKSTIDKLARLGETKFKARQTVYEAQKEKIKAELIKTVAPINSKKLPQTSIGEHISAWHKEYIKAINAAQKTGVGLTPMEGLADVTGMQPMKIALDKGFGNYLDYDVKNLPQLKTAMEDWHALTKDLTEGQRKRIGAYAAYHQEGGMERLANSGYTEKQIKEIKLTPAEQRAYDFIVSLNNATHPAIKQYGQEVYNEDIGKVDNYVSFISDSNAMNDLELYDRFGNRPEEALGRKTKTVEQGYRKARAEVSNIKLELDIDKIFRRHIDDVVYMLTMGKDIKMYFEIVNSPEMREKLGDVGALAWLQWLDLMARKGGAEGAQRIAWLDNIRRNIGGGVLAFRLSSAMVQFSSFGDTMATIGVEWATKGANNIATSKEWREFIMDNFPEIRKALGDDIAFRELGEDFFGKLSRVGMVPLQALDSLMRMTAASGSYEKLCREKGVKVDLKNPDLDLIQKATKLMRQSQGSSFFKDQPLALTTGLGLTNNRSLNKAALTFQSFNLGRWDNVHRQIYREGIKKGKFGKAGMSALWIIIFTAAVEEGLRRGSRKILNTINASPREEKALMGEIALNIVQNIPLAGQIISSINYSSSPVPVINTFSDLIKGAGNLAMGKSGSAKWKGFWKALGAAASLRGVGGATSMSQILQGMVGDSSDRALGQ